ncbi:MAG: hypothetical protein EOO89_30725, partial [Pedobacter sp.]
MADGFNFNVAGLLPTNTTSKSADPIGDDINKTVEEFAKLLIAQITNQDPDKPAEMTETITQYSQMLASLGQIKANNAIVQFGQVNVSQDLVGKKIAYTTGKQYDSEKKQYVDISHVDVVTAVDFTGTAPAVRVAGSNAVVPVANIIGISNNETSKIKTSDAANLVGYSTTVQTFQTGQNPIVITNGTASIGFATASINLVVQHLGNPAAIEYGIYYSSTTNNPDVNSPSVKVVSPTAGVNVVVNLNDLTANKTYYYRSFARLASGEIIYGPIMSFTTQADPVAQDLIASVAFTDQSLLDVSGFNNHVKLVDNPTFTTDRKGKANSAIFLDGVNDYFYMDENSNNSLNPEALSVSIWFK